MTFDLQTIGEKKTFMEMIVKSVIDIVSDYCSFIPSVPVIKNFSRFAQWSDFNVNYH